MNIEAQKLEDDRLPKAHSLSDALKSDLDCIFEDGFYKGLANENLVSDFQKKFLILNGCYLVFRNLDELLLLNSEMEIVDSFYPKPWWYHRYLDNGYLTFPRSDLDNATELNGINFITSNTVISDNLFHLTIDNYARIFYFDKVLQEIGATIIFPANRHLTRDYQDFHEAFTKGLINNFLAPGIYKIQKLIVPPRSFINEHLVEEAFLFARDKIRNYFVRHAEKRHGSRLFVSRADTVVRNLSNEAELIEELRHLGFTAVCPGDFSLATQLELFSSAEIVVGVHGMGLASIVALPQSCLGVYEFEALQWSITGYRSMCAAMQLPHGFLPHKLITTEGPGQFHWIAEADIAATKSILHEILSKNISQNTINILKR